MSKIYLIDGGTPTALADENSSFTYNLLPVGNFYDKRYGKVNITPQVIQQIEHNFGSVPSYEVPVKIGHGDGAKSPGKVLAVQAKDNGLEVSFSVDPDTAKAINDKQYRYMSAEIDENYQNKTTGEFVGPVLKGAALVNQPGIPNMSPLVFADDVDTQTQETQDSKQETQDTNKGDVQTMNELEEARKQLADAQAQLKTLQEEKEAGDKKFADLEAQNKALLEERERSENERNEAEVKTFSDKWTAQGIPPAVIDQVKPLLLGKNSRTLKFSDNEKDDKPTLKFFDDLFGALPKMPMTQVSENNSQTLELSDNQKAIERGKAIAGTLSK